MLLTLAFAFIRTPREPTYNGKRASKWFEEALMANQNYHASPSFRAFGEMEGDAVPFLARWVNARPSTFEKAYAKTLSHLPRRLARSLPQPRSQADYYNRRNCALQLLASIGSRQRFKADAGEPSTKPSVALAVPAIQAALRDTNGFDPVFAAQAAWYIGPPAAVTIPDLIRLARVPNGHAVGAAVQAFGLMGPLASNAVPVLLEIAGDAKNKHRRLAVQSLGEMGATARPAIPLLVSLLTETNELQVTALRSLAEIGFTPDAAVPALTALQQGTNEWAAALATLALWNREPHNARLSAKLAAVLHTEKRGWLLFDLRLLGTNAALLADEVRSLENDSDPDTRRFAKSVLRNIRP